MDSAGRTGNMIALVAMVALVFILVIDLTVMIRVTMPQVRKFGWRVLWRIQRMPLPGFIYPVGADLTSSLADELRQYGQTCPKILGYPIWPMGEPVIIRTVDGSYSVQFGGSTYRIRFEQSQNPGYVTVSSRIRPRPMLLAAVSLLMGFVSGRLSLVLLGLAAFLWLVLVEPFGFGFVVAQSVQRAAGRT